MTREELIKALRCFASEDNCPVYECNEKCPYWMESDKFDRGNPKAEISDEHQLCRAAADLLEQDVPPTDMVPMDFHERCMEMEIGRRMLLEQNAPKWLSVKDRLPNVDEKVIVFAIGKYDGFIGDTVYAMSMILDRPSGKRWAVPWQYFDVDYEITHWMRLPEPPKEEEND